MPCLSCRDSWVGRARWWCHRIETSRRVLALTLPEECYVTVVFALAQPERRPSNMWGKMVAGRSHVLVQSYTVVTLNAAKNNLPPVRATVLPVACCQRPSYSLCNWLRAHDDSLNIKVFSFSWDVDSLWQPQDVIR